VGNIKYPNKIDLFHIQENPRKILGEIPLWREKRECESVRPQEPNFRTYKKFGQRPVPGAIKLELSIAKTKALASNKGSSHESFS